jgi:hypothetical protein
VILASCHSVLLLRCPLCVVQRRYQNVASDVGWIGKDLKGRGLGLIMVLSSRLCGGTKESHERPRDTWCPGRRWCLNNFRVAVSEVHGTQRAWDKREVDKRGFKWGTLEEGEHLGNRRWWEDNIKIDFGKVGCETHYVTATKPNRLMLFGETVAVYCENHMEHTNTPCRQNASK